MYFCSLVMVCVRRRVSVREMNSPASLAEGIKEVRSPGRTIRRREEDSASSRTKLFIDDGYMSFVLHPSSPIAAVAEHTIPPPYLDVHRTSLHPSLSRHVGINEERRGKFVIMLCVLVIV